MMPTHMKYVARKVKMKMYEKMKMHDLKSTNSSKRFFAIGLRCVRKCHPGISAVLERERYKSEIKREGEHPSDVFERTLRAIFTIYS